MILDIHSHRPAPYPDGVVCLRFSPHEPLPTLLEGQLYSVGIHPWDTEEELDPVIFNALLKFAESPQIVAVGECGIDPLKGGPMFRQLQAFRKQVVISERLEKPLVIHAVKSYDIIMGLKRDLKPTQPWILHGFRGKPSAAQQLTAKGIYLSFGENFNAEALRATPPDLLLAETDESPLSIEEIIARLSEAAVSDLTLVISSNTHRVVGNRPGVG